MAVRIATPQPLSLMPSDDVEGRGRIIK